MTPALIKVLPDSSLSTDDLQLGHLRNLGIVLQEYEQPPLDATIDAELQDYVARRKPEIKIH